MTWQPPLIARVWKEGGRIYEERVIAAETDGDEIELVGPEETVTFSDSEWDELTVDHNEP